MEKYIPVHFDVVKVGVVCAARAATIMKGSPDEVETSILDAMGVIQRMVFQGQCGMQTVMQQGEAMEMGPSTPRRNQGTDGGLSMTPEKTMEQVFSMMSEKQSEFWKQEYGTSAIPHFFIGDPEGEKCPEGDETQGVDGQKTISYKSNRACEKCLEGDDIQGGDGQKTISYKQCM